MLGRIGGLIRVIELLVVVLLTPFIANNTVIAVSKSVERSNKDQKDESTNLDSFTFYLKKTVYDHVKVRYVREKFLSYDPIYAE